MLSCLLHHGVHRPDAVAFIDDNNNINYRDLVLRVAFVADTLRLKGPTVGIMAPNGIDWVIAYLSAMLAGKTIVPLPPFFSDGQLSHIIEDSGVDIILGHAPDRMAKITKTVTIHDIPDSRADDPFESQEYNWNLIIYTSGTTGTPKGVCLNSNQVSASVSALTATISPNSDDRYLSILPFSLLLEQITGILLPIRAGVCCHIAGTASMAALAGNIMPFVEAINEINPSLTVLVPNMLSGWISAINQFRIPAPDNLRFVAAGGAPVPRSLTQQARKAGIPVFEGYGLSECCSVVAVNCPGADKPGSAGRPLPGVSVCIEAGEIVVSGANVMTGYLGGKDVSGCWATGDMGFIDDDGYLYIQGRIDTMLVTSLGRNVNPEWIEGMMMSDPRIHRSVIYGHGQPTLGVLIIPSADGKDWFDHAKPSEVLRLVECLCHDAPDYAQPGTFVLTDEGTLGQNGLINTNGQINRRAIDDHFNRCHSQ